MKKRKIIFLLFAILILAIGFVGLKFFGPSTSTPSGEFFYIKTGSDFSQVKKDLVSQGFLSHTTWFDFASKAIGYKEVKPGRYKVKKGTSIVSLVKQLRNGSQTPVNFVITKIRTKENLAGRIGKLFETDSLTMLQFLNNNDSLSKYDLDSNTVMAAALPLTYPIKWNSSAPQIFEHFNRAYKTFWNEDRKAKASAKNLTPIQVTTMASIIEEETNKKVDKPLIASTYLNRLEKGMKLQADPTVKFALKDFSIKRILHAHLTAPSPYNTYMNTGLPPGPICTPSEETIEAVLNAPKTDYLFFVANSNFDGTHIFTTNYDDHLKYAKLYQTALTEWQKRKAAEAAANN